MMGPSNAISGPALAEPPLAYLQAQLHPNDSLLNDQGHFLDNEFDSKLHRKLSIFGWKKAFRFGLHQQANLGQLQKLGFFVALPVGFDFRFHTPPGYTRDRLIQIFANATHAADKQINYKQRS